MLRSTCTACTLLVLLQLLPAACRPLPPVQPPPAPEGGTACERACDRLDELGCDGAGPACPGACQRREGVAREADAPALSWRPECVAGALSCHGADRCRGGQ